MKTVMKKMFSLLLVAVLMVGAMPFQAFAAENVIVNLITEPGGATIDTTTIANLNESEDVAAQIQTVAVATWGHAYDFVAASTEIKENGQVYARMTPKSCGTGGCTLTAGHSGAHNVPCDVTGCTKNLGHDGGHAIPCDITGCTLGNGHSGEHTVPCTTEGCTKKLGHEGDHNIPCSVSGCSKQNGHEGEHTVPCTTSGCALNLGHAGEHKCACNLFLQVGSGHNTSCPYYEANNKTYSLKVWAKLWVGNSLNKTILLDEFTDLDGTEVVPYIIGNNVSRLESKFPSGYNNIEWTKAVYYYIDSNTTGTVDTNMNVNEEDNVYINLYSQEKLFVVNVHLGKYYGIDSTVKVGGFRVGETVSYDDVLKAVKKQYNVSSLKMYTYDNWCKVVEGKTSSTSPYFQVHDGDNVYEVYVSGSRKTTSASGSSSATADSSNPKTGDMIFAPVAVMGLSVSALAVLFFLNKKRAY